MTPAQQTQVGAYLASLWALWRQAKTAAEGLDRAGLLVAIQLMQDDLDAIVTALLVTVEPSVIIPTDRPNLEAALREKAVPDHLGEGLIEWILTARPVGSFLFAVITNDLKGACTRADDASRAALCQMVQFLYNDAPAGCWGSREAYEDWREQGGLLREPHDVPQVMP